jgi:hypothetical protein
VLRAVGGKDGDDGEPEAIPAWAREVCEADALGVVLGRNVVLRASVTRTYG